MSSLNIINQSDAVHLITDGATYDLDGLVIDVKSKCTVLKRSGCAIASRGRAISSWPIQLRVASSLEEVLSILPDMARESLQHLHQIDPDQPAQSLRNFEIIVAGWSKENDTGQVYGLSTHLSDNPDVFRHVEDFKPFEVFRLPVLIAAPAVSLGQCLGPITSIEDVDALDAARAGKALLEAQRRQRYDVEGRMLHVVGGFGEITSVTRSGVSQQTLVKWPDKVGRSIEVEAA